MRQGECDRDRGQAVHINTHTHTHTHTHTPTHTHTHIQRGRALGPPRAIECATARGQRACHFSHPARCGLAQDLDGVVSISKLALQNVLRLSGHNRTPSHVAHRGLRTTRTRTEPGVRATGARARHEAATAGGRGVQGLHAEGARRLAENHYRPGVHLPRHLLRDHPTLSRCAQPAPGTGRPCTSAARLPVMIVRRARAVPGSHAPPRATCEMAVRRSLDILASSAC